MCAGWYAQCHSVSVFQQSDWAMVHQSAPAETMDISVEPWFAWHLPTPLPSSIPARHDDGQTRQEKETIMFMWPNSIAGEPQALIRNRRVHAQPVRQSMLPIFGLAVHVALGNRQMGSIEGGRVWWYCVVLWWRMGGQVGGPLLWYLSACYACSRPQHSQERRQSGGWGASGSQRTTQTMLSWEIRVSPGGSSPLGTGYLMSWRGRISTPVASLLNHHKMQGRSSSDGRDAVKSLVLQTSHSKTRQLQYLIFADHSSLSLARLLETNR